MVVIGTLHSATENIEGLGKGYILVDRVVTKEVRILEDGRFLRPDDNLKVTWADNWACVSGMHLGRENKNGIWLLTIQKDGTVTAGYPGRFRDLGDLREIEQILARDPNKKVSRVDVLVDDIGETSTGSFEATNAVEAIDVSSFDDYSPYRGLFVALVSLGLYWFLYRSRFRIR